ncbi:MAG: peptidylprolyl isomerase [Acidobacteria bacterium]|nr:peptidylprolyl isomerase [Acidobacteriota bacterium]
MLASDIDAVARANAARLLGAAEDKTAIDLLIKAATSDADSRVRVSAIRSLGALKDPKAVDPMIAHGTKLLADYKRSLRDGLVPAEHGEFVEVAVALGQMIPGSFNEAALKLFKEFATLDKGATSEVYVARVRIAPAKGDGNAPELTSWKQYRTLALIVGEFAGIEPPNEDSKKLKAEAPGVLEPLARAMAEADAKEEPQAILAAPDTLRAFARFGTESLDEILRIALRNPDVQIRAAAASLLGDRSVSEANLASLKTAAEYALVKDLNENDAALAAINAIFKLNKVGTLSVLDLAAGSPDNLIRRRVHEILNDEAIKGRELSPILKNIDRKDLVRVRRYAGKGTRLGQVLNTESDYRRAAARKNGAVRAELATLKGTFTIELLPDDAPLTVDNFIRLANSKYFDGLEVHRVVPNFVMQDGDPRGDGTGGPGWTIRCEVNMVPYGRGTVGMALAGKDTGGSQWFVTHAPQPHLDGGYTVFGRVNERDMAVVDRIVQGDKILTVRIVER